MSEIDLGQQLPEPELFEVTRDKAVTLDLADAHPLPGMPPIMGQPVVAKFLLGGTKQSDPVYPAEEIDVLRVDDSTNQDLIDLLARADETGRNVGGLILLARDQRRGGVKAAAFLPPNIQPKVGETVTGEYVGREGGVHWFDYGVQKPRGWNPFEDNLSVSRKHLLIMPEYPHRLGIISLTAAITRVESMVSPIPAS